MAKPKSVREVGFRLVSDGAGRVRAVAGCDWCGKNTTGRRVAGLRLCTRCKTKGQQRTSKGVRMAAGVEDRPGVDERIDQLRAMYEAVSEYPTESAARAAGLPTTAGELPWMPDEECA